MRLDFIQEQFKKKGFWNTFRYYFCRAMSKAALKLVGPYVAKHGKLHRNYIVFKNRTMQDMTDNARAFYEYLIQNEKYKDYRIIWMVSDKRKFRNYKYKNVKFVTAESKNGWTSPLAYYYGAVSGFFFYTNNSAYLNLHHCPGQVTVNLWHGCGYKDVPREKHESTGASMMHFDYALVPGKAFVETKSRYWKCPKEKVLPLGYPRYDWMLRPSMSSQEIIRKLLGMTADKMIIWMPTFRNSEVLDSAESRIQLPFPLPGLRNEEELKQLDVILSSLDILLIIKKHAVQTDWHIQEEDFRNICYVDQKLLDKKGIQLYELISASDGLISDYSSVAVDYMLLNRPLAFVLTDMQQYKETRGFVFEKPEEYMPGEKVYDLKGLETFAEHIASGEDLYRQERARLLPIMHQMPVKENYAEALAEYLKL